MDRDIKEINEILDTTRIHPENYVLAKKIAKDALEDDEVIF
jgi:transcriptional accessory protein Tex/SPT6